MSLCRSPAKDSANGGRDSSFAREKQTGRHYQLTSGGITKSRHRGPAQSGVATLSGMLLLGGTSEQRGLLAVDAKRRLLAMQQQGLTDGGYHSLRLKRLGNEIGWLRAPASKQALREGGNENNRHVHRA